MAITTIAVGLDGTDTSHDALAWAHGATSHISSATLRAIHVWTTPVVTTYSGSAPSTEALIRRAREVISSAVSATSSHVDSVIVHGSPGPSLTAEASGADLLVVGRLSQDLPSAGGLWRDPRWVNRALLRETMQLRPLR